jgi:hypothetical protein
MTANQASRFGIEFFLLIALPAAVLVAGAFTMTLAFRDGFTPMPETHGITVNPR